jgi:hypothetical protein
MVYRFKHPEVNVLSFFQTSYFSGNYTTTNQHPKVISISFTRRKIKQQEAPDGGDGRYNVCEMLSFANVSDTTNTFLFLFF